MAIELPTGWSNFLATCNPPPICTDSSIRGQQVISVVTAFDLASDANRASWGYINDGELWALGGNAFCTGGNMGYTSGTPPLPLDCLGSPGRSVAMFHFINDEPTAFEVLPVPSPPGDGSEFINVLIGTSDRSVWAAGSAGYGPHGGIKMYFDEGTFGVVYDILVGGGSTFTFAVKDDEVWLFFRSNINPPVAHLLKYDRLSGTMTDDFTSWGNDDIGVGNLHLTDDFLYCIGTLAGVDRLYRIHRATGVIDTSIIVTALNVNFIAVANDNLIYFLCNGSPGKVYYLENFTTLVYVGSTTGFGFSPFAAGAGIWNSGNLYFGSTGFAGFSVDVRRIAIECPPEGGPPIIASVTTDSTVAAGANINVSWADVLLPISTDTIVIKPAPAAGVYGLAGSTIATGTNAGALSDGSVSITIPGGTTPGNYVAMYAALGYIWVATSAVFTVT